MKITKDKFLHFGACAIVAAITSIVVAATSAPSCPSFVGGLLGGVACGLGKEYGDHCASGNKWSWGDVIADTLGAAVGGLSGVIFNLI